MGSTNLSRIAPRVRRRAVLLSLVTLSAFSTSLLNGFVYDDQRYIVENPFIASWTWENLRVIFTRPYFGNFHPIHLLTYAAQRSVFGLSPIGWHAVSLGLHVVNVVLLYRTLPRLGLSEEMAFWGAALFAIHPIQAESVAWVSEQKNLLSLMFTLLALRAYIGARETGKWSLCFASVMAFLAALASKVASVGLVPVLFLLEYRPLRALPSARGPSMLRLLPFILLAGVWMNLAIIAHGRAHYIHAHPGGSMGAALLSIAPVLTAYFKNILWPTHLAAIYQIRPATEMNPAMVAAAWAFVGLGVGAAAKWEIHRRDGRLALALVSIAGFLAPVMNLVPIGTLMNDRYLYAPFCAIGPLLGAGMMRLMNGLGSRITPSQVPQLGKIALWGLLIPLTIGSAVRSTTWRNTESLWTDAVAKSPKSAHAHYNLGTYWMALGRDDLAERELREAVEADPMLPRPYQNLGAIHHGQRKYKLAAAELMIATHLAPKDYELWMNLALVQGLAGRDNQAIDALQRASRLRPGAGEPHYMMAVLLKQHQGKNAEANDAFKRFMAARDGKAEQRADAEEQIRNFEAQRRNQTTSAVPGMKFAPNQEGRFP